MTGITIVLVIIGAYILYKVKNSIKGEHHTLSKNNIEKEFTKNQDNLVVRDKANKAIQKEAPNLHLSNANEYNTRNQGKAVTRRKAVPTKNNFNYLKGKKAKKDSFVAFDIETTGLSPNTHEIIEIGAIKINDINSKEHQTFQVLIKPSRKLSKKIISITGITDDMLSDGDNISSVIKEFKEFIGDLPLVAHNASFDCGFIKKSFTDNGLEFTNDVICTLALSRKCFPNLENHKLATVKKHINYKTEKEHRAMDDAMSALFIYTTSMVLLK